MLADEKTAMLQEFAHFHPKLVETMRSVEVQSGQRQPFVLGTNRLIRKNRLADDVKCWPLFIHDPLPTWVYGKVVLVGDAAHPVRSPPVVVCIS